MRYIITILFTYLSLGAFGQNLDDFLSKVQYLHEEYRIISFDFLYKSGALGVADLVSGHGIVKKNYNDTLGYNHNILINYPDGNVHHQIYDGKNVVEIMLKDSKVLVINVDSFDYSYQLITGNMISSLQPYFLYTKGYLDSLVTNKSIEKLQLDTLNIFNRKCYQLKIKHKDSKDLKNDYSYYYVDAHTMYPIGYRSFFEYNNTKLEKSFILSNIFTSSDSAKKVFDYKIYKDFGLKLVTPKEYLQEKSKAETTFSNKAESFISKYKGKIVVVDFWYIGCAPCFRLMPVLEKLHFEFPNVEFVGINPIDNEEKLKKFTKIRKLKYPVFYNPDLVKKYNIKAYPVVVIFDKEGNIVRRLAGYSDNHYNEIKSIIEDLKSN